MPNVRGPNQKLIASFVEKTFAEQIEEARAEVGLSLSQFLRDAIRDKLLAMGKTIRGSTNAPDRAGKGGPRKPLTYQLTQFPEAKVADGPAAPSKPAKHEKVKAALGQMKYPPLKRKSKP